MPLSFDRKYVFILILLFLSGAVAWSQFLREYTQSDTVDIHLFPMEINGWVAEELPITEREYAVLETRNAFTRRYARPGSQPVTLFIVYSQTNRKVAHPPEICYTGSGAVFADNEIALVETGYAPYPQMRANKFSVEFTNFQQLMYYWFKVGDTYTSNYLHQQVLIAIKPLLNQPASGALIRLTADVTGSDRESADQSIREFIRVITPLLGKYLE